MIRYCFGLCLLLRKVKQYTVGYILFYTCIAASLNAMSPNPCPSRAFGRRVRSTLCQAFVILFVLSGAPLAAQVQQDTAFLSSAIAHAKNNYSQKQTEQPQLYNGSEYVDYPSRRGQHPYFISENWMAGSLHYNGQQYHDVSLLYNSYTDNVIIEHSSSPMLQLAKDKVVYFSMQGHEFVLINEATLPTGFYERLCNGNVKAYAKRIKEINKNMTSSEIQIDFIEKSKFYIFKEGKYYLVRSKKSVLAVFSDRKKELNQFIRKKSLTFQKNRDSDIAQLTAFYNQLP